MWRVPLYHVSVYLSTVPEKPAAAPFLVVLTVGGKCAIYTAVSLCGSVGVVARGRRSKEGNPSGLPSLSHYCKSVNQAPQTHAGRGFEYMQRMSVQTNLHTHGLHKMRPCLQPQSNAQLKRANLTTAQAFPVFFVAGNAGKFDTVHNGLYHFVFLPRRGALIFQNLNCSL